jgi:hypothetical protein
MMPLPSHPPPTREPPRLTALRVRLTTASLWNCGGVCTFAFCFRAIVCSAFVCCYWFQEICPRFFSSQNEKYYYLTWCTYVWCGVACGGHSHMEDRRRASETDMASDSRNTLSWPRSPAAVRVCDDTQSGNQVRERARGSETGNSVRQHHRASTHTASTSSG